MIFDKVGKGKLWQVMEIRGISKGLIERITKIYEETICA